MQTDAQTELAKRLIKEIDDLLAMRQGFVSEYRKWRQETYDAISEVMGPEAARKFDEQGPKATPINRQHRVHLYRQTLDALRRFLADIIGNDEA